MHNQPVQTFKMHKISIYHSHNEYYAYQSSIALVSFCAGGQWRWQHEWFYISSSEAVWTTEWPCCHA